MVNYGNGKIYCIRSHKTDKVYVGSTTQKLCKRMTKHRAPSNTCTSKKFLVEYEDAYIELIENYPCNSVEELLKREGHFIRTLDCINYAIAGRTSKEWYIDNKDIHNANTKQYYRDNIEAIKEQEKQRYEDNKVDILNKAKADYQNNKAEKIRRVKEYRKKNSYKVECPICLAMIQKIELKKHQKRSKKCKNAL